MSDKCPDCGEGKKDCAWHWYAGRVKQYASLLGDDACEAFDDIESILQAEIINLHFEQAEQITRLKEEISGCILRMDDGDFPNKGHGVTELERKLDECIINNDQYQEKQAEQIAALIDEINPHNPMAKKEMDRIIKELAAKPQGGE